MLKTLVSLGCGYPFVHILVGFLFLMHAARSLRLREATAGPLPTSEFPLPPRPADPPLLQPERASSVPLPPLDAANPVLWKERCVGWRPSWAMPSVARVLAVLVAAVAVIAVGRAAAEVLPDVDVCPLKGKGRQDGAGPARHGRGRGASPASRARRARRPPEHRPTPRGSRRPALRVPHRRRATRCGGGAQRSDARRPRTCRPEP